MRGRQRRPGGRANESEHWYGDLFDALEARALSELLRLTAIFVLILGLTMGVTALHLHVKRWVQLDWRRWTTALHAAAARHRARVAASAELDLPPGSHRHL